MACGCDARRGAARRAARAMQRTAADGPGRRVSRRRAPGQRGAPPSEAGRGGRMGPGRASQTTNGRRRDSRGARTEAQQQKIGAGGGKTRPRRGQIASEARRASGARRPEAGEGRDQSPKGPDSAGCALAGCAARGRGGPEGQPPNSGSISPPTRNPDASKPASCPAPLAQARRRPGRSTGTRSRGRPRELAPRWCSRAGEAGAAGGCPAEAGPALNRPARRAVAHQGHARC